ncbi:cell division control protein 48 homolog B-like [Hibiscus syriacus]|uniref:cell division control protein 48 homolog B-like n=1 Tax=Hibiscus syriacus TaxID=106335 RepID=UPI001923B783|nr:cell division control protein 48 homolog B-like [Hibiscus syriacus]
MATVSSSNNNSSIGNGEISSVSEGQWKAEEAIGGNAKSIQALRELIVFPLLYSCEAKKLGLKWPRGLLLYGPPGTGKTSLVRAIVRESGAHLIILSPHSVHRAHAGESEKILREAFSKASSHASSGKPSVIFIDEIDALCPRRDSRREQDVRLASQLLTLMDSNKPSPSSVPQVVVVASTNRVDAIDPALRRSGRFDDEVEVTTPNEEERFQILKLYTKKVPLDPSVDLQAIAASCNGYVGADLEALCREATMPAVKRSTDAGENLGAVSLTVEDWTHAKSVVGPSITRGVTVDVPNVSWDDIGGLKDLKKKLQQAVEWPIKHSAAFARLGISPMRGVLLHGPPGCSKTTLAKAAAHAAQASFFSLSGAELYSMYVGEGESLLRNTFRRARLAAPSIIFFDEADVVAAKRGGSSKNSSVVGERLLSTLLTEMDGLEQANGILVLAATNRPHAIDPALMRPGRFDLVLYVPPPDMEARYEILRVHTRNMKIGDDVDLRIIAEDTELFTGAELEGLCREAGIVALRENISAAKVGNQHFETAKKSLKPALTRDEIESYSSFMKNHGLMSSPVAAAKTEPSTRREAVGQKSRSSLSRTFPIEIGVLGVILLVAGRYIFKHND